jgi:hypothetical protein
MNYVHLWPLCSEWRNCKTGLKMCWQTNVHNEEQSGQRWPSAWINDCVQSVDQKICERQCFTISELSCEFPLTLCTFVYKVIIIRIGYHKLCATWVPKMLTAVHKTQNRMASAATFLEQYNKAGPPLRASAQSSWVRFSALSDFQEVVSLERIHSASWG